MEHAKESGFTVLGLTYSPIRGPEGNIEYLGYLEKGQWQERTFDLNALVDGVPSDPERARRGERPMNPKKIILCPNPNRDRGMKTTKRADKILREMGFQTVVCSPFKDQKDGRLCGYMDRGP